MEWLKLKWTILGFDAPWFIWLVAGLLLSGTIGLLIRLRQKINDYKRQFEQIAQQLKSVDKPAMGAGVSLETAERLRQDFAAQAVIETAWHQFETSLVTQNDAAGHKQVWRTNRANSSFSEENLITEKLNKSFYQALPSVITGFGLLMTFLAILVALLDVKLVENRVQGLELLIQGLSGKFISSIGALFCATVFLVLEKRFFHDLEQSRLRLVAALDQLFPQLSTVQMLVNLESGMSGFQMKLAGHIENLQTQLISGIEHLQSRMSGFQTQLVGNISSFQTQIISDVSNLKVNIKNQTAFIQEFGTELAPILRGACDESITPTMNRMVKAIEDMNGLLRASEANKNESISETIEQLLKNLQDSMTRSIAEMSSTFSQSLSGSAQEQFEKIATTLSSTATMLDAMNTQFAGTQNSIRELNEYARTTTTEQIEFGQMQIGELRGVMKTFMGEMSTRVNELGHEMGASLQRNAENASQVANNVMAQAEHWATQNGAQVGKMMEAHETQFAQINQMRETLAATTTQLNQSTQNAMRELIEHARTTTSEQVAVGQQQIVELSAVMQAFMGGMSTRANELNQEMGVSLQRNSETVINAANNVIMQAQHWMAQNNMQIAKMLEAHETQFAQINQMREILSATITQLNQSMQGMSHIANTTQISVETINKAAISLQGVTDANQKTQASIQKIADASTAQLAALEDATQQQVAVWQGISDTMQQYEQTFGSVEGKASELLQEVTENLENYQQVCASGFAKLVSIADEHFVNASQKLGASVGELDEHLQDLSEAFERLNGARDNGNRNRQ